jgi:hypothetical protein
MRSTLARSGARARNARARNSAAGVARWGGVEGSGEDGVDQGLEPMVHQAARPGGGAHASDPPSRPGVTGNRTVL